MRALRGRHHRLNGPRRHRRSRSGRRQGATGERGRRRAVRRAGERAPEGRPAAGPERKRTRAASFPTSLRQRRQSLSKTPRDKPPAGTAEAARRPSPAGRPRSSPAAPCAGIRPLKNAGPPLAISPPVRIPGTPAQIRQSAVSRRKTGSFRQRPAPVRRSLISQARRLSPQAGPAPACPRPRCRHGSRLCALRQPDGRDARPYGPGIAFLVKPCRAPERSLPGALCRGAGQCDARSSVEDARRAACDCFGKAARWQACLRTARLCSPGWRDSLPPGLRRLDYRAVAGLGAATACASEPWPLKPSAACRPWPATCWTGRGKCGELRILVRLDAGPPFGFAIESLHLGQPAAGQPGPDS